MTVARTKISWRRVFILISAVLGLCVVSFAAIVVLRKPLSKLVGGLVWKTDPAFAAQTGREILDYDLPAGYGELMAANIQNERIVIIGPQDGSERMLILLQEGPIVDNDPAYQSDLQILWSRQVGYHRYKTEQVGTQEVLVRGKPVTLVIREGYEEDNGRQVRQWVGLIDGKNGLVLLVVVGDLESWDQDLANQFIQSIR